MHALRVFLLVAVVLVGMSEGILVKKLLLKKAAAVKAGLIADVKTAALKFKAGAALKKDAILGSFKALGKAKLGIVGGIKAAKLKVLGGIAAVKLAKLAAIKAGKLAFVKTLAAAKLAPLIAQNLAAKALLGKGAAVVGAGGSLLKGSGDGKDQKNFLGDIAGLLGSLSPFGDAAGNNPFGSILGDVVLGALTGGSGGKNNGGGGNSVLDFISLLGNSGGRKNGGGNSVLDLISLLGGNGNQGNSAALIPKPGKAPTINIQTYQVNPPHVETFVPPTVVTSYGTPSQSYALPATSYGVPQY